MTAQAAPLRLQRAPSALLNSSEEFHNTGVFSFVQDIFEKYTLEGPWEAWYHFKDTFVTPSQLGHNIRALASNIQLSSEYNQQTKTLICDAIYSQEFPQLAYFLTKIFNLLNDQQLNEVLAAAFDKCETEPLKLITKLKGLLTLEKMECAVRSEFTSFQSTRHDIDHYANLAKHDLENKNKQSWNNIRRSAYHYAISLLDHFVNLFSIVFHLKNNQIEEGDPSTAQLQAQMQYTALMQNLSLISGWVIALSLWLASAALTVMVCGFMTLFGSALVYLYYNFLQPCPENAAPFKNIITQVNLGNISPISGREKEIEEVINYLCSNDSNTRQHPLLVGASGVGKTQIVQGLAHRMANNDVPDVLKDKKLFVVNTTDLVTGTAWGKLWNLEKMLYIMKGHENDAVFFFDEIHVAFNTKENSSTLGQKLKTLMDPGPNNLKFCIGATTIKEFTTFIEKDDAILRRMPRIFVESMSPDETKSALLQVVYDALSTLIVENGIIDKLAYLSKNHPEFANVSQPYKSLSILNKAFTKARTPHLSPEKIQLAEALSRRNRLIKESAIALGIASIPSSSEGLNREASRQSIDTLINHLEPIVQEQTARSEHLRALIRKRHDLHQQTLLDAVNLHPTTPSAETLKLFLLEYHYYRLALFRQIDACRAQFQAGSHEEAPNVVYNWMIDFIISEEATRRHRVPTPASPTTPTGPESFKPHPH